MVRFFHRFVAATIGSSVDGGIIVVVVAAAAVVVLCLFDAVVLAVFFLFSRVRRCVAFCHGECVGHFFNMNRRCCPPSITETGDRERLEPER